MHAEIARAWTVEQLAALAVMSRSAFYARFTALVGAAPMEYLLGWRMERARRMLRDEEEGVAAVAGKVGYGSASAFSVAFRRYVGESPGRYARGQARVPIATIGRRES